LILTCASQDFLSDGVEDEGGCDLYVWPGILHKMSVQLIGSNAGDVQAWLKIGWCGLVLAKSGDAAAFNFRATSRAQF
jgi:hypothetical protein